jgi:hypothetical protein
MTDSERESHIDRAYEMMCLATTPELQRSYFADMCYHVKLRSPEQVLKMEAERRISAQYAPLVCYAFGDDLR